MSEQSFLLQALELAAAHRGFCAPNPAVGAVLVQAGVVIATGVHRGCGSPHAERDLLSKIDTCSADMILFVTLEPCCHFGRTPPCTDIIIEKKIKQVVYAHNDPNPIVNGGGQKVLTAAGISCRQVDVAEVEEFYRSYDYWHKHKLPFVTAKLALSADEKTAGANGVPVAITGGATKIFTHQKRLQSDAILITAATIIADDPQMNCRLTGRIVRKPVFVLDRLGRVPKTAKIFQTTVSVDLLSASQQELISEKNNQLDWQSVLQYIASKGVQDLWVEAGAKCFFSLFESGFLNEFYIYQSKKIIGNSGVSAFTDGTDLQRFLLKYNAEQFCCGDDEVFWGRL